jgi:CheY-like chemotaxis protein
VLFSDVVMPEMNGIELAQRARSLYPGLKVLLASGYAAPTLMAENASADDFQFISKPYRIAEIIKKLRVST